MPSARVFEGNGGGKKKFEQAIMARNMARNNSVMVVLP
jgi:hypothetical protein